MVFAKKVLNLILWRWKNVYEKKGTCEPPCSVLMYLGMGNLVCKISCASSTGACKSCLKFSYSGISWYFSALHWAIVYKWKKKEEEKITVEPQERENKKSELKKKCKHIKWSRISLIYKNWKKCMINIFISNVLLHKSNWVFKKSWAL